MHGVNLLHTILSNAYIDHGRVHKVVGWCSLAGIVVNEGDS
jgi:hypothetical protein